MSRVADGALRAIGEDAGDPASKDAPHHIVFDRVIAIRRTIWDLWNPHRRIRRRGEFSSARSGGEQAKGNNANERLHKDDGVDDDAAVHELAIRLEDVIAVAWPR